MIPSLLDLILQSLIFLSWASSVDKVLCICRGRHSTRAAPPLRQPRPCCGAQLHLLAWGNSSSNCGYVPHQFLNSCLSNSLCLFVSFKCVQDVFYIIIVLLFLYSKIVLFLQFWHFNTCIDKVTCILKRQHQNTRVPVFLWDMFSPLLMKN